jgi:salicylate hydroxylase
MNGEVGHREPVESKSTKPLKIVIVGAGIGGLFAAIALRNAGHHVEIYESSRFAVETGAAIHLPPNVNGLLRRYGMIPEDHGAVTCEWITDGEANGELGFSKDLRGLGHAFAYPWQLCHRIDLHNALKEIATRKMGKGEPVVIHLQSKVVGVDVERASLTLQTGENVEGDLILGADGVHVSALFFSLYDESLTQVVYRPDPCPRIRSNPTALGNIGISIPNPNIRN